MAEIKYIPVSKLWRHPDNPRKDLGDVTELAESIKVNGVLQNLTVVPRYYIEKPRSGSKKIVTPNGEVISCEYTEDPHKATGTGFAPHWGSCRAAGSFKSREERNG